MTVFDSCARSKLLLLMGPPGAGKSTIIGELQKYDERFEYIRPFMTRELRSGEVDKVSVSEEELQQLWERGDLLVINELYGVKYGTPLRPIREALDGGRFPVIDWPIFRLSVMETTFPGGLFRVYVKPPTEGDLMRRLIDRNNYADRLEAAHEEMRRFASHEFDQSIDLVVETVNGKIDDCVVKIYREFLKGITRMEGR